MKGTNIQRSLVSVIVAALLILDCVVALSPGRATAASNPGEEVTFNRDIAPILYRRCVNCHRPGENAPMSLLTYSQARPWARSIREKVITRQMPPWHADPRIGEFANDRHLSQQEIDTIRAWVDEGAKEGNPQDLPPAPGLTDGWNIGKPDVVFYMPREYTVPAAGVVEYKYFSVPTNFKKDVWIRGAEARPGARSVVHHIFVYIREGDEMTPLLGFTPGEEPMNNPDGLAMKIPAGSQLVFQIHYTPNGTETRDRSYVGLTFAEKPPKEELFMVGVMNAWFTIPPGDPNYQVESSYTFSKDVRIQAMMPHMHLRGKNFEYRLTYPDGASRALLSVPGYDSRWQNHYILKNPLYVPKGTRIDCVAHFDNSEKNKYNPDPAKEVRWGDQAWEEMMVGWVIYSVNLKPAKGRRAGVPAKRR